MKDLNNFIEWYNSLGGIHNITSEIYDKLELKFK